METLLPPLKPFTADEARNCLERGPPTQHTCDLHSQEREEEKGRKDESWGVQRD